MIDQPDSWLIDQRDFLAIRKLGMEFVDKKISNIVMFFMSSIFLEIDGEHDWALIEIVLIEGAIKNVSMLIQSD